METTPSWMTRALRIILISAWVSLAVGIVGTATSSLQPGASVSAAVIGGGFVVASTALTPRRVFESALKFEILVVAGAVLTAGAVTLTGATSSPYLLLSLMPTLLAALVGGFRVGLTTGVMSASLVAAVAVQIDGIDGALASAGTISLFPLMALLVGQIRSILVETEQRASTFEEATIHAEAELVRLSQANDLLRRLTDVYAEGGNNPVDVGRSAIEAIVDAYPNSFATATLFDSEGPVVVARAGTDSPELVRTQVPLGDGTTTSGVVSLATARPLTPSQRVEIDRLLRPVAVAFSNAVLLQEIAGAAVQEERLRLARELHDEVGPALAALGLGVDAVTIQVDDPSLSKSLGQIREGLGTAVEDLRGIIGDLRAEEAGSLTGVLRSEVSDLAAPPDIDFDVHERRPPGRGVGRQLATIVTEAIRNAYRHADAHMVTVTGFVDRDRVEVDVKDDGKGFDPTQLPEGHYGILGMRERADRIGASVEIESGPAGTNLKVTWKEQR